MCAAGLSRDDVGVPRFHFCPGCRGPMVGRLEGGVEVWQCWASPPCGSRDRPAGARPLQAPTAAATRRRPRRPASRAAPVADRARRQTAVAATEQVRDVPARPQAPVPAARGWATRWKVLAAGLVLAAGSWWVGHAAAVAPTSSPAGAPRTPATASKAPDTQPYGGGPQSTSTTGPLPSPTACAPVPRSWRNRRPGEGAGHCVSAETWPPRSEPTGLDN
jgi:hypothetical protein